MDLYTQDGGAYFGMSEETIRTLRLELGRETVFITKEQFDLIERI